MKRPGFLRRRVALRPTVRFHRRPRKDPVTPAMAQAVFEREVWKCIATRFDPAHVCEGRLTIEHVPGRNENAMGKRGRYLTAACLGAQQGWCLTNRESERLWLEAQGVMPRGEGISGHVTPT